MNILLVDDDYLLAKGTAKLIQRLGNHNVLTTEDPQVLFQQCRSGTIDLVLMDVNLPAARWNGKQVSGADLTRSLKSDPRTARIPVILITAYAMLSERQKLLEASQADEFFAKPITSYQVLLETMDRLHARSRQLDDPLMG